MGFTETMTLSFVICKLAGLLDLSWWFILLPELLAAVFYLVVFVAIVMAYTPTKRKRRK